MSDYDNGFKRAQQMYDNQEQPTDDEPEPRLCPKCGSEHYYPSFLTKKQREHCGPSWCRICGHEEKVRE